jgi:hypothetical protein
MHTTSPSETLLNAAKTNDWPTAEQAANGLADEHFAEQSRLRHTATILGRLDEEVFRDEQRRISERISSSVSEHDVVTATELLRIKREEQYRPLHDALIDYKASSYDWHLVQFGPEQLLACQRDLARTQQAGFTKWEEGSVEDHVRQAAYIFALHLGRTTVIEEADRYRFVLDPCGTGGKMALNGSLSAPLTFHARVPGTHAFTFGREDFPAYCAHCAVWNEISATEWFGHPQWVFSPWRNPGDPCGFSIYKDPTNIPAELYAMVGLSRPNEIHVPPRAAQSFTPDELAALGELPTERLQAALDAGNWSAAVVLCDALPKEYVLMVKGLRLVLEALLAYNEAVFIERQLTNGDHVRAAVLQRDASRIVALVNTKEAQHRALADMTQAFIDRSYAYHLRTRGPDGLVECRDRVAAELAAS